MIGTALAHYRITAALGAGGMGEVWRATDEKLGREVALKVLPEEFAKDPERMARFEREAKGGEGAGELESSEYCDALRLGKLCHSERGPGPSRRIPRSEIEKPNSGLSGEVGGSFDSRRRNAARSG